MLFSKAAFLAIVSAAAAEPVLIHMSAREIFGLLPRQGDGYSPTQTLCTGGGTTCQSACGPSFDQCPSNDGNIVRIWFSWAPFGGSLGKYEDVRQLTATSVTALFRRWRKANLLL